MLQDVGGLREPQRLSQQLSTLLAAEIVSGRIAVGEAFPSSEEIVNRFGVSRTVARETVQALAMLGMVNVQHGKRTEVLPEEDWDVLSATVQEALRREGKAEPLLHDLYEFRLLIEPQAAAWMAEHGRQEDVDALTAVVERMEGLLATGAPVAQLMEADRIFHGLIARASENRVLAAVSRDIREVIATLWGFSTLDADDASNVVEQHRRISDAICGREPREAATAMREHLSWAALADLHGLGRAAAAALSDRCGGRVVGLVIGIDTGGTFTDMVVFDPESGHVDSLKTSSTPAHAGAGDRECARRGRGRRGGGGDLHARHDGRHECADRADRLQGRRS